MTTDPFELMLRDYVFELIENLKEAGRTAKADNLFECGRRLGLYEALSTLKNMCVSFDLPMKTIGLDNINPDHFLSASMPEDRDPGTTKKNLS